MNPRVVIHSRPGARNEARRRRGFTLLELIVVTSILGVVVGAVAACIASGIRVWERAQTMGVLEARCLVGMEILERDLRNAFLFYDIRFRGEAGSLSFPGLAHAGDWMAEGAQEVESETVIGRISYALDDSRSVLLRTVSPYSAEDDGQRRTEAVVSGIVDLSFKYFEDGERVSDWRSRTNMPDRVDISLRVGAGTDRLDLERVVLLQVTTNYVVES